MSFRLYKEGQGIWARGTIAFMIGVTGLIAASKVFDWVQSQPWSQGDWMTIPVFHWSIGAHVVGAVLTLIPFGYVGHRLYNLPKLADFLIETETELKTKVTWPTFAEAKNNAMIVVVACIILGTWIFGWDQLFRVVGDWFFPTA